VVKKEFVRWLTVALVSVSFWQIASKLASSKYFPSLLSVLRRLLAMTAEMSFWRVLLETCFLSFSGFIFGVVIAIVLGIFLGLKPRIEMSLRSTLNFLRSMPVVAILPILIAGIGSSIFTVVLLASFAVSIKLVVYVINGLRDVDVALMEEAKVLRLPIKARIFKVYVPSGFVLLSSGLRLAAELSFGTVVLCGIFMGTPGLGSELYQAESNGNVIQVFSYVVVLGAVGVVLNYLFGKIESKLQFEKVPYEKVA
jgi:ABC-type nitrate/sulfonate/bicarbonate transport system permease component